MTYDTILFDLDGTLTDPGLGITNSVMYALEQYGISVSDRTTLYSFIGPPLADSFRDFYGFSQDEAKKAVELYRVYYRDRGIYENVVYDGIDELLHTLSQHGKTLLLATSKPEVFAKQILEHFDLSHYFTFIAGSKLDGTRVKKAEIIQYALEGSTESTLSKTVMIGDREHDILGAKAVGIDAFGVLYGYGNRDELLTAGADRLANTTADIAKLLLP